MKTFTLYKRDGDGTPMSPQAPGYKEAPYYFTFKFRGSRYQRCTDAADADEAQRIARIKFEAITEAVIRGDLALLDKTKIRHVPTLSSVDVAVTVTVDELIKAYKSKDAQGEAKEKTKLQNAHALKQLLRTAIPGVESGELTIDNINGATAATWFASRKNLMGEDQAEGMSIKRSGNSRFRQAVSLFTPSLLDHYKDKGVYCASFEQFVSKGRALRFKKVTTTDHYRAPNQEIIDTTLASWLKLEDRNLFLAAGLALSFGLRAGEIAQVKWSFLQVRHNSPALVGAASVKNGTGAIESRALDPFFSQMIQRADAMGWRGKPDEYVLTGHKTERTGDVWRRLSDWMQELKWDTQKQAHALRAYSGSKVFQRYSPRAAQLFLNHASVNVTEQFYSHFASKWASSAEELQAMPERWATTTELAQPVRILQTA